MSQVPCKHLLEMTKIEPHEDLRDRGVLVDFHEGLGKAAFVSHQWVSTDHPDPAPWLWFRVDKLYT